MEYTAEAVELTERVKENARRYGFDLVGVVPAEAYDAVPNHFIGHRDYKVWTKKTEDYMKGARSLVILGARVWDSHISTSQRLSGSLSNGRNRA